MLKHAIIPILLFSSLSLSGCFLMTQNETYSQSDVCAGLKRQMIYNKISPNVSGDTLKYSPARLQELYQENNCE